MVHIQTERAFARCQNYIAHNFYSPNVRILQIIFGWNSHKSSHDFMDCNSDCMIGIGTALKEARNALNPFLIFSRLMHITFSSMFSMWIDGMHRFYLVSHKNAGVEDLISNRVKQTIIISKCFLFPGYNLLFPFFPSSNFAFYQRWNG